MFDGKFREIIPYWRLTGLTGAKIVSVEPTVEAMVNAVNEKTAAVFLFPATLYEEGIPTCEEVIPELKRPELPLLWTQLHSFRQALISGIIRRNLVLICVYSVVESIFVDHRVRA